ncbi:hypothetical protein [Bradyrhizobium brasilense]|uniref:Uncharacterized protein n=1 Tax=Bradyrhizobium brasilense TaxID=1419277 RepID=A0ABY8JB16_9BRAD|nr:hypothetical protein [Bradyrhizobium brasilense]WFU62752.1 hypothetical protein QA636_35795 [Bradyrhizobium brasilense]
MKLAAGLREEINFAEAFLPNSEQNGGHATMSASAFEWEKVIALFMIATGFMLLLVGLIVKRRQQRSDEREEEEEVIDQTRPQMAPLQRLASTERPKQGDQGGHN